ncbi:Outer membrane porin F precursor [Marinomonas spartinae]|uniref:Outer membrane porin F n=1 Tax=Marinomonas spartinae TaxID=1792290 RepID=A0A1A8T2V9_9GAMM|nr:OmpA family protein [Marinomonas spartinae]SBS25682.1 Outer membrane porin F precursor [Marinomonas spartinae]SBS39694.1 Outer membrane porin F precursor [Marinomonas spartinae]
MSILFSKRTLFSGIIAASSLSTMAFAAQPQQGFTVTPSIGHYHFDNDTHIDDNTAYSLGLGYQFNNPWGVEFNYLNANSKKNGNKVDVNQYRLDGIYNIEQFSTTKLTPYLAAGIGAVKYDKGIDTTHTQVNVGGGVKYALAQNVALRGDFRLVEDTNSNKLDNVTSLGVQYTFGGPSHASTMSDSSDSDSAYSEPTTTTAAMEQSSSDTQPAQSQPNVAATANSDQSAAMDNQPVKQSTVDDSTANTDQTAAAADTTDKAKASSALAAKPDQVEVKFATNSVAVPQSVYPKLQKIATYMQANPDTSVTIKGYTDNTGTKAYNVKLSEKRALAVGQVLSSTFNIPQSRISTVGYGEAQPVVPNDTPAHREQNRRVIAVVVDSAQ